MYSEKMHRYATTCTNACACFNRCHTLVIQTRLLELFNILTYMYLHNFDIRLLFQNKQASLLYMFRLEKICLLRNLLKRQQANV